MELMKNRVFLGRSCICCESVMLLSRLLTCKFLRKTHKYGVEEPKPHKDAMRLDALDGDTKWEDARKLEMGIVGVAFEILKPR